MIDHHYARKYARFRTRRVIGLALLSLMVSVTLSASGALAGPDANAGRGGEPLEVRTLLVPGKITVIDFFSPFCAPCMHLAPLLEQLADKRSDLAVQRLNINRPGVRGIDWQSPLVKQYRLKSVPHFMIFSPEGKLLADGQPAAQQLQRWLRQAGLMKN